MSKGPMACCPESKPICGKIVGVSKYSIRCLNCNVRTHYATNKDRAWRAWWGIFTGNPTAIALSKAVDPKPTRNVARVARPTSEDAAGKEL